MDRWPKGAKHFPRKQHPWGIGNLRARIAGFAAAAAILIVVPQQVSHADEGYTRFLFKLQSAFASHDRQSIIRLTDLPLRVNFAAGPRSYRDRRSVARDFSRIFTAKVRLAVLRQKPDTLFVRDQGAMVGNGELWFRNTCPNSACSPAGDVLIVAVNP